MLTCEVVTGNATHASQPVRLEAAQRVTTVTAAGNIVLPKWFQMMTHQQVQLQATVSASLPVIASRGNAS